MKSYFNLPIEKIKGVFIGVLLTMSTWMIVTNLQETIFKYSPIKNQYILALVLIIIAFYLGAKK